MFLFRQNCHRATEGFNHVLSSLAERAHRQHEAGQRRWQEVRETGAAVRDSARRAAGVARAHSTLRAEGAPAPVAQQTPPPTGEAAAQEEGES